ncbi:MAG: class II fumarate hydratase, partial [Bacteroidales bacterium]|nr:class II fumarate hydratase [Bacteroidales bacterium]
MDSRTEKDTMGEVAVPADAYWGAQTQRSLNNFKIGNIRMPQEIICGLAIAKKAAACANYELNVLSEEKKNLIAQVCDEIIDGKWDDAFPLIVWQTGSGTQTNMNINEVIANRAEIICGGSLSGNSRFISPNDDVNKSQSTNDIFPTAMRIAVLRLMIDKTIPAIEALQVAIESKS